MFTGSSSSCSSNNENKQNAFPSFKTVETIFFGDVKITSPYSEDLKFQNIQGNLTSQSTILLHNLLSYTQHFNNPSVPNAFFYSITALNRWLKHLEEKSRYFEDMSLHFENLFNNVNATGDKQLAIHASLETSLLAMKKTKLSENSFESLNKNMITL